MKRYDMEQGTPEWLAVRIGIPTASRFDSIITPTGKKSSAMDTYINELVAEQFLGSSLDDVRNDWMIRGRELEAPAVAYYEFQHDVITETVGFITLDNGLVGCSPDRFVCDVGMLEIKCPKPSVHIGYLRGVGAEHTYKAQVQGNLWICEREWSDLEAWHPELPSAEVRCVRDDTYIKALAEYMDEFIDRLQEAKELINKRSEVGI